jgi:hypothetical protein
MLAERLTGHKGSALGFCSGIVAGLVAVTPAAGNSGPFGAIVLGAVASIVCFFAVSKLKPMLGYDDALDAFGVHGIGGMIGAVGTGIVYAATLGGPSKPDYNMGHQLLSLRKSSRKASTSASMASALTTIDGQGAGPHGLAPLQRVSGWQAVPSTKFRDGKPSLQGFLLRTTGRWGNPPASFFVPHRSMFSRQ